MALAACSPSEPSGPGTAPTASSASAAPAVAAQAPAGKASGLVLGDRFLGVDITGAPYAKGLTLTDAATGQPRSLSDFKGKAVVLFFGYTHCPDVCPTTLSEVVGARELLGPERAQRVQAVFVTVDPERDAPKMLNDYVKAFDPSFVALHGSPAQVAEAAKEFKVYYSKVPGKSPDAYTVDHTAASMLFDPEGRVRVYVRYGAGPQALAHDLALLLQGQ